MRQTQPRCAEAVHARPPCIFHSLQVLTISIPTMILQFRCDEMTLSVNRVGFFGSALPPAPPYREFVRERARLAQDSVFLLHIRVFFHMCPACAVFRIAILSFANKKSFNSIKWARLCVCVCELFAASISVGLQCYSRMLSHPTFSHREHNFG